MRGVSAGLLLFSVAVLALSAIFAWRTTRIENGWDPRRLVVDTGRVHRYEPETPGAVEGGKWLEKMAQPSTAARLPADESTLSWDLVDPEFRKNVVLVLRFDSPDRFQRRCLENFLLSRAVEYTIDEREHFDVRLKTKEETNAHLLIDELATYDLTASLVVLRETKPY